MNKLTYSILLAIAFAFAATNSFGQTRLFDANLQGGTVHDLIRQLEKQTKTVFYYDSTRFDSVEISIDVKQQPLAKLLDLAFAGKNVFYTQDEAGHVFITRGHALDLSLPKDFLSRTRPRDSLSQPGLFDDDDRPDLPAQKTAIENKLIEIGSKSAGGNAASFTIVGYVKDAATGEPVAGASVYIEKTKVGAATDQYGYYAISVPRGRHVLSIQSIGMRDTHRQIQVYSDGKLNIDMQSMVLTLKRVIISAQKISNVKGTQMGLQKMDIKTIRQVPVVFGEADVLRVVTTLPGVKTTGEASTGLNVRGGAADQNLILFNDATIYNPSHFFGMFSAFNPEVVKDVELYKSSIPARYGGRLSSVLNITSREGNKKNITGSAGIGLLTSRLDIEGPLMKDRSSFIIGGRTTYANWLLKQLPSQYRNSKASFYDFNASISHEFNKKNSIYLSGYTSHDKFNLNSDTTYGYGNTNFGIKWKHIFNNKLNALTTTGYDRYAYKISSDRLPLSSYTLGFDINQLYLRSNFNYYLSSKHTLDFGLNSLFYKLHPGNYQPLGDRSLVIPQSLAAEQALENSLYISDHYNASAAFSADLGIRFTLYDYLGPQQVNEYAPGIPKTEGTFTGTKTYNGGVVKAYGAPEFRVGLRYAFSEDFSVKAGFNTQRQYIHSLSNTTAMAPTDIWKLSDPNIKPQEGGQVSFGLYKNFKSNTIETSVEVYYKKMKNYLDYKSGASLVLNDHIETDVMGTVGKAYGVEFLLKKSTGKLNGWISYTWSRTLLQANDPTTGEIINRGDFYPANYDKPHDVTAIGNYRFSHRFSVSVNATYSTGRPITLPVGLYNYAGSVRTLFADRNSYRIPDYFRADFSINIDGNHKVHQRTHNSWTVGVYNVTGRKNPYSVYYVAENGAINGYKLSIFGSAIPYINFNIRF